MVSLDSSSTIDWKPVVIKNYGMIIPDVFAVVNQKRIYVFIGKNKYKEAFLNDQGTLYFANVTRTTISKNAAAGSAAIGVVKAILPFGLLEAVAADGAKSAVKESGTTRTLTDVIVDFETGDMHYKD